MHMSQYVHRSRNGRNLSTPWWESRPAPLMTGARSASAHRRAEICNSSYCFRPIRLLLPPLLPPPISKSNVALSQPSHSCSPSLEIEWHWHWHRHQRSATRIPTGQGLASHLTNRETVPQSQAQALRDARPHVLILSSAQHSIRVHVHPRPHSDHPGPALRLMSLFLSRRISR